MKLTPIKDLRASYIDVKPINYDWGRGDYGEVWEDYEARRTDDDPNRIILNTQDSEGFDGPVMSYFYPLPEWSQYGLPAEETALRLVDLPLCLVRFIEDDTYGLALTGAGMDFSWSICEAFMVLGYLPPIHFANLPVMAGSGRSTKDRWIIQGCLQSWRVSKQRAGFALRSIRQNFDLRRGEHIEESAKRKRDKAVRLMVIHSKALAGTPLSKREQAELRRHDPEDVALPENGKRDPFDRPAGWKPKDQECVS